MTTSDFSHDRPAPAATAADLSDCDVVMKGGISSGIVYPRLIVTLADKYRFRRIGGASAGAIAATMTAAAEAGRRTETPDTAGRAMQQLAAVPDELADNLHKLFQPSKNTESAFEVLMASIRPGVSGPMKVVAVVLLIIRRAFGWFLVGAALAMIPAVITIALVGKPQSASQWMLLCVILVVWLLLAAVAGVTVAATRLLLRAIAGITDNGFGMCDGHTARAGVDYPPLTDWMEHKLRDLAGLAWTQRPVCFMDLWGAEATVAYRDKLTVNKGESRLTPAQRRELGRMRDVDCLVMTTNLSLRRPYRFPFDIAEFYWCKMCFAQYFPDNVIQHMEACTEIVTGRPTCSLHREAPLYYMPLAPDVPLVVAARISLSFPGLISAVPFQTVDRSRRAGQQGIVTLWFSDGGISSNFPMRFFDAVWPRRPTFGINLAPRHPDFSKMVWRSEPGQSGRFLFLPYVEIPTLVGFAKAIVDTMQNWVDATQISMPGFRDRVVEIRQNPDEGGMNLRMPRDVIQRLAARGADAGRNILYGDTDTDTTPFDFGVHRWIRYRIAMSSLDELLTGMYDIWPDQQNFLTAYSPPPDGPKYQPKNPEKDRAATRKVMDLVADLDALGHPAAKFGVPRPEPAARLIPPL
jgi:predicted acylesterase/phospholipase RssA